MIRSTTLLAFVLVLLEMAAAPARAQSISGVQPSSPYPGHPVTIAGSGFSNNTSEVAYDGTSVNYRVISDTEIRARVPAGASSDASFAVTTGDGTATGPTVSLDTDPSLYGSGRALSLDGSGDYVATGADGNALGLARESFSIDLWYKLEATDGGDYILVGLWEDGSTNEAFQFFVDGSDLQVSFFNNDLYTSGGLVSTGTWQHVAFVYDASTPDGETDRFVYLNGEQIASNESSGDFQGTAELFVGHVPNRSRDFDGEIDQVRVWEGALSQAEVRERAYRTIGLGDAAFSELEAAWRFDAEGSGGTAFGFSDQYRNGTFHGDASRTAFSGARLGQALVSTTGSDAAVGPSGGTLSAANVSTGSGESIQLYRFGAASAPRRSNSDPGELIRDADNLTRSNLTWGLATSGGPSADLTIDYSGVQGVSSPVHLIRRDGPGDVWKSADGWTHDSGAQTFTVSGTAPVGQYAVKTGSISPHIYVDKNATGANNGSSWNDAYTDLQAAINNASSSSEIWVAEGIYNPDSEGDSFTITGNKDGIELYGGFEGTETSRDQRAPKQHRTILSGDLNGDDTDPDSDGIIEDADPDQNGVPENLNGTNATHVLVVDGGEDIGSDVSANVTSATVIDGLYVTAGHADGSDQNADGGGLFCDGMSTGNACSPTLRNVTFTGNAAADVGGAIHNDAHTQGTASPQITNAVFTNNAAALGGGAIGNDGTFGGTINPRITNTVFASNTASTIGGAIYSSISDGTSNPAITNVTFTGNAADKGGAIYTYSGYNGTMHPTVTNAILRGNSASVEGDEIFVEDATVTLSHTILQGGTGGVGANSGGSVTYLDDSGTGVPFANSTNLDEDPQFADAGDPAGPDDTYATSEDGLQLTYGSPALDAGTNASLDTTGDGTRDVTTDLIGGPRVVNNDPGAASATVDLGAYEAPSNVLLPVELAGFEGTTVDGGVRLQWQTASEQNNAGFRVERKGERGNGGDGAWTEVGFVEGSGTTTDAQTYRFTDDDLPYAADSVSYRLKQVDTDGTTHLTDPVTVARSGPERLELLGTYPNPVREGATVRFAVPEETDAEAVTMRLYDVLGRQVRTVEASAEAGRHEQLIDVSGLSSGVYVLRLRAGGATETRKLTVVR